MVTHTKNFALLLVCAVVVAGCSGTKKADVNAPRLENSGSIGSYGELMGYSQVPVVGYGLVGGLGGTGSADCPPEVRTYLKQFILSQLPKDSPVTVDELLSNKDNAVVVLEGLLEPGASKGQQFDLRISALPGSQTISLAGGNLYPAELTLKTSSRRLAIAQGPVFLNGIDNNDPLKGFVLGGGSVLDQYNLNLALFAPDFMLANTIRNRINERFGDGTATALSAALIRINFPAEYNNNKPKFIALLKALYIGETMQAQDTRVLTLIQQLGEPNKATQAEYAIEAVGRAEQDRIAEAIKSDNAVTRFRAARCLLNMGNDSGLGILRSTAIDHNNLFRIAAIEAIAAGAKRQDARSILYPLLGDNDLKARVAAYEALRKLEEPAITSLRIAGDFDIDVVKSGGPAMVYVYRTGQPRIVLFGSPIAISPDVFVESKQGNIILTSDPTKKYINVIRKHPKRNIIMGPLKSNYDLKDILITLCGSIPAEHSKARIFGLGASYDDAVEILKIMSQKGIINAGFSAGELPKTSLKPASKSPDQKVNNKTKTQEATKK